MSKSKVFLYASFALIAIYAALYFLKLEDGFLFPIRMITVLSFIGYGIYARKLSSWIFVAMAVGIEFGHDFPEVSSNLKILSDIFLKLVKSIIAPLLFATLVVGIAGHSNLKQVGRMGLKALLYFEIVTTIALFVGLAAINISKAGSGLTPVEKIPEVISKVAKQDAKDIVLHIFPENIAKSVSEGQILQVVIFSIFFGIGLAMVKEDKRKPVLEFCESLSEVMFKFTGLVMYIAPIGVFGAIAYTISQMGVGVLTNLFQLLATLYLALIAFVMCILLPVMLILKIPVKQFFAAIKEPVTIAFATASSEAALPKAMEQMEKFGVSRQVVAFVLPTGYSFNLDGTTLYLALASIFVAQAANIPLSFSEQLIMVFTLMLTSKGVAGVPRASLVILLGTVASFNLPEWPVYIILGIDTLMDMARTAVNVTGNCLASVVVAKWENEFDAKNISSNSL